MNRNRFASSKNISSIARGWLSHSLNLRSLVKALIHHFFFIFNGFYLKSPASIPQGNGREWRKALKTILQILRCCSSCNGHGPRSPWKAQPYQKSLPIWQNRKLKLSTRNWTEKLTRVQSTVWSVESAIVQCLKHWQSYVYLLLKYVVIFKFYFIWSSFP